MSTSNCRLNTAPTRLGNTFTCDGAHGSGSTIERLITASVKHKEAACRVSQSHYFPHEPLRSQVTESMDWTRWY